MRLPSRLSGRRGVVLDTMILIYMFEDHPRFGGLSESVVAAACDGRFHAVVTPVTTAELLVKPLERNRTDLADRYRHALSGMRNVSLIPLSVEAGFMAGALRAKYGLPMPDMLQVAAAMQGPTPTIISNDNAFRKIREVDVLLLADFLP